MMKKKRNKQAILALALATAMTVLSGCGEGAAIGGTNVTTGQQTEDSSESAAAASTGSSSGSGAESVTAVSSDSTGSVTLFDGTYTPDAFGWSGGSGRASFSIGDVTVRDGQAYATLTVGSTHYQYFQVNGKKYDTDKDLDAKKASAEIPVQINKAFKVSGYTTAMSTGHLVDYQMYVGMEKVGNGMTGTSEIENWQEGSKGVSASTASASSSETANAGPKDTGKAPEISGLTYQSQMELDKATGFDVYYYNDGYKVIEVYDSAEYLVVPEGKEAPSGLSSDIVVIQQPLDHIYLAATSAMSLFNAIGSLDAVTLTGTDTDGWDIDAPKEALASGKMKYAGKYSEPDYEMLVGEGCDLAIESTMILHSPDVQELIEKLGIPVFIDRSSYESDALGRTEWIKLYGALMNKEDEAKAFFDKERDAVSGLSDFQNTGKTVAFFTVTQDGTVTVRSSNDYIPNMIKEGGGKYIFDDLKSDTNSASVDISMEQFYSQAENADYLIYNATIEDKISSVDDLISKDSVFADFKAVKEGNVWQVDKAMYQSTDIVSRFITDVNIMLTDGDQSKLTFLSKVS